MTYCWKDIREPRTEAEVRAKAEAKAREEAREREAQEQREREWEQAEAAHAAARFPHRAAGDRHARAAEEALAGEQPDYLRVISEALLALYYETRHQDQGGSRPATVPVTVPVPAR